MYKITKVTSSPSLSKNTRNVIQGRIQLRIAAKTEKHSGASEEWTDVHTLSESDSTSTDGYSTVEQLRCSESNSPSEDGYSPVELLRCAEFSRSDRLVYPSSKLLLDFDSEEFEKVIPLAASTRIFTEATFSEDEIVNFKNDKLVQESTSTYPAAPVFKNITDIPLQIPAETENCSFVEFTIKTSIKKYDTSNVGSRSSCEISGSSKECGPSNANSRSSRNISSSSKECGTSNACSKSSRNIGSSSKECGPSKANSRSSRNIRSLSKECGTSYANSRSLRNISSSSKECGTSYANSRNSRNISGSSKYCGTLNADSRNFRNVSGTSKEYVTLDFGSENLLNGSTVERDFQEDSTCRANFFFNSLKRSKEILRNYQRSRQDASFNPKLHNTVSRSLKDISNHKLPVGTFVTDRNTSALGKQNAVLSVSTKRTKRDKRSKALPAHLQDVPICCLSNNKVRFRPSKFMKPTYRSDVHIDALCLLK